jgi:hypothetical protein
MAINLIYEVGPIAMVVAIYLVAWVYCALPPDGAG